MSAALQLMSASFKPAVGGGGGGFDETWPGVASAALPAGWVAQSGSPVQNGAAGAFFSAVGSTVRDTGAANRVITAIVTPDSKFPGILFRADATGASVFGNVVFNNSLGILRFYEHHGGTDDNIVDGATPLTLDRSVTYTVEITLAGTSLSVRLKAGAGAFAVELTATLAQGLTNTYAGIEQLATPTASAEAVFGEIKAV